MVFAKTVCNVCLLLTILLLCQQDGVQGFVTTTKVSWKSNTSTFPSSTMTLQATGQTDSTTTVHNINNNKTSQTKKRNAFGVSLVAAAVIAGNILSAAGPAAAAVTVVNDATPTTTDFGSTFTTQLLAARSGGRVGGRSAGARMAPSPAARSRSTTTTNTRVIERTRYIPTPGVVGGGFGYGLSAPGIIVAPPIYNPYPGIGLGIGLNAINQIGNDMRDYRQENEIQSTRAQLEQSRMREAEMEARLRQLEMMQQQQQQGGGTGQLTPQQQQQLLLQMQQQSAAATTTAQ